MHCSKPGAPIDAKQHREREGDRKTSRQTQPIVFISLTNAAPVPSPHSQGVSSIHPYNAPPFSPAPKYPLTHKRDHKGTAIPYNAALCHIPSQGTPAPPMPRQSRFPDPDRSRPKSVRRKVRRLAPWSIHHHAPVKIAHPSQQKNRANKHPA